MPPAPQSDRPPIQVSLVEDDLDFQNALMAAIQAAPDMTLRDVAGTRALGLRLLEGPPCDVLLVDLGLPDGSGIDVIHGAHARWPACEIMVSSVFGDETNVIRSIEAGASGYLLKDSGPEQLVAEIRSLCAGGSPISPLIARKLLTRLRTHGAREPTEAVALVPGTGRAVLSAREQQVLEFITKGFSSHEIAGLMAVSTHTVLTYVRRIYSKLEVSSRTEAVYEARHQGLLAD